jgi:RimJ/RimL family protein N-acetyltransferase
VEKLVRTELTDGTLLLRPWGLEDVPRVTEACQDPEIPRWTAVIPEPYTEADARTWIEQTIREWDEHTEAAFAVTDAQTGEVLGAIGLNLQQHFALQASIGYGSRKRRAVAGSRPRRFGWCAAGPWMSLVFRACSS